MDTLNKQGVAIRGSSVVILFPRQSLTPEEAMMFAAWLVVMAQMLDDSLRPFGDYLAAVENT